MLSSFLRQKDGTFTSNVSRAEMLGALRSKDSLLWVDLESPSEFESECLVEIFNFHPLAIEDCLSDCPQPKIDDYDEYLFLVMHAMVTRRDEKEDEEELAHVELDIFVGENYVVTVHRTPLKTMEQMRGAIGRRAELYMGQGADYLVHAILDRLVDNYQPILDKYDAMIDELEEEIFNNPPADYLSTLMQVKHDIFNLRRSVAPQRDVINFITKTPTNFIRPQHMIYFRDVYDHLVRIYSTAESYHEQLSNILSAYFSYSSHKINDVVKHMTVLATLTMPAVIVASVYGMNFKTMPQLEWDYGFWFSIGLMVAISAGMLLWMKFKKWI